jgi:anti-anti-sigma factor
MEIDTRKTKNALVLTVAGRLDAVTSPEFEKRLSEVISQGETALVIAFSGVEYISSAGLRSILAAAKMLKQKRGTIVFTGLRGSVEEVFKISGFWSLFKVFDSEEAALQGS